MKDEERLVLRVRISQSFRPGTPVDKLALFAGRMEQVTDIIRAVNQPGQHVIMYGERGVGKTSLSRVLFELLSGAGMDVIRPDNINCDGTDNFSNLWHKVFREMSFSMVTQNMGFRGEITQENVSLESMLPENVTPDDIRYVLSRLNKSSIIVLDELDRIENPETKLLLADTIKNLSDHAVKTTIVLIGVADSVDGLIKEHRSIERALVQVPMPRMSREELYEILDKGTQACSMTIETDARKHVVDLSAGLPHYTHTLGLYSAENAVSDGRIHIVMADVNAAIRTTTDKSTTILETYHRAVYSPKNKALYPQVLLACALAQKDDLGYFTAASIRQPLLLITGKPYTIPAFSSHLDEFCNERRGPVLHKSGSARQFRFRFINPLMQPFVVIHGISKGLLRQDMIAKDSEEVAHEQDDELKS